jgi:hypothetical protein
MERRVTGEGREILVPPSAVGEMEAGAQTPPKPTGDVTERPEEAGPYSVTLCCTFEARRGEASHPRAPAVTRSQVR